MASEQTVGVGLIGAGARVRHLLQLLLQNTQSLRVRGICDPTDACVEDARKIAGGDIPRFGSAAELVRQPDIDWVMIGSWNCFHREHAVAALQQGKHVFCEKPLATSLEDCLAIDDAWRKSGRTFFFGLVLRYSPHYQLIRKTVASGRVGEIISMEFNETLRFDHGGYIHGDWRRLRKNAGTHMLEKCCHDLDLAQWIVGSLPVRVASFGGCSFFVPRNLPMEKKVGDSPSGRPAFSAWKRVEDNCPFTADKDIVDNQVAIMEFGNQARATFHTNCCTNIGERRMYICGSLATLRADVATGKVEIRDIGHNRPYEALDSGVKGSHGGADGILAASLVNTMLKGEAPLAGVREGIISTTIANGIDRAMDEARIVDLQPVWDSLKLNPVTGRGRD